MNLFRSNATLKPLKAHKGKRSELAAYSKKTLATLGTGSMKQAVQLPQGENLNEWLAVNTVDFFNELSMLYGTVGSLCTDASCPVMCAGDKWQYLWCDGVKVKKPIAVSAPVYVDCLMTWVESQLNDEDVFPIKFDAPFPKRFTAIVATINKRFCRVYVRHDKLATVTQAFAHIYHHHIVQIEQMQAATHLNTCFKHFIYYVDTFDLVSRDEQAPLRDLIDRMYAKDQQAAQQQTAAAGKGSAVAASGGARGGSAQHEDTLTREQDVVRTK